MKKVYKIKVNEKVYEIELEELKTVDGKIETKETKETKIPVKKENIEESVESSGAIIEAPMPGVIVDIKVKVGETIKEGDLVAIIEAMKMETELYADKGGTISAVNVGKGSQINAGDTIIIL